MTIGTGKTSQGDPYERIAALEDAIAFYEARERQLTDRHEFELALIRRSRSYRLGRLLRRLAPRQSEPGTFVTGPSTQPLDTSQPASSRAVVEPHRSAPVPMRSPGIREAVDPLIVGVDSGRSPDDAPVAIIAGFDSAGRVGLAQQHLGRSLRDAGFYVVLIQDAELAELSEDDRHKLLLAFDVVMGQRHGGYDFNSWRLAIRRMPQLNSASEILLVNDSVIGPLWSIRDLIDEIHARKCDVVGAVESSNPEPHLQSWFVWFGSKAVKSGDLQRYLELWRPGLRKRQLIEQMEVPLARTMVRWGYRVSAIATAIELDAGSDNPSIYRWDRVLDHGIPFVKRELFLNRELAVGVDVQALRFGLRRVSSMNVDLLVEESTRQLFPG